MSERSQPEVDLLAERERALQWLDALVTEDPEVWSTGMASKRLTMLRAHVETLARTRHLVDFDGLLDRAELAAYFRPLVHLLQEKARLPGVIPAHLGRSRLGEIISEQTAAHLAAPPPLAAPRCLVDGHPDHPECGCVLDDPSYSAPPLPPPVPEGLTAALMPTVYACIGVFHAANPEPVRAQRCLDLAHTILSFPPREQPRKLAALIHFFLSKRAA